MAFYAGIATVVAEDATAPVEEKADVFYLPRVVPKEVIDYGLAQIREDYEGRIRKLSYDDGPIETQRRILEGEMERRLNEFRSIGDWYRR